MALPGVVVIRRLRTCAFFLIKPNMCCDFYNVKILLDSPPMGAYCIFTLERFTSTPSTDDNLQKGWRHSRQHCSPPAWRRIMDIATRILSGSPWWVYGLLALLIWLGLQAARPRTVSLSRVLISPALFIGWGIVHLMLRSNFSHALLLLVTAASGPPFSRLLTPTHSPLSA